MANVTEPNGWKECINGMDEKNVLMEWMNK